MKGLVRESRGINKFRTAMIGSLVAFMILFPKSGINNSQNQLPLTVLMAVFLFLLIGGAREVFANATLLTLTVALIVWLFFQKFHSDYFVLNRQLFLSALVWFVLSPILWQTAYRFTRRHKSLSPNWILIPFFLTVLFGAGQYFFGLDFLRIDGLTISSGDSYLGKNLTVSSLGFGDSLKTPSTYQSGNMWGQCAALILIWILQTNQLAGIRSKFVRLVMVSGPILAIILSLSRTAFVALIVGLIFLRSVSSRHRLAIGSLGAGLLAISQLVLRSGNFTSRFGVNSLNQSSGRTEQWRRGLEELKLSDWLFGTSGTYTLNLHYMEGLLGMLAQVGFVGLFLLIASWRSSGLAKWTGYSAALITCVVLDSTYIFVPFMWLTALLILCTPKVALTN